MSSMYVLQLKNEEKMFERQYKATNKTIAVKHFMNLPQIRLSGFTRKEIGDAVFAIDYMKYEIDKLETEWGIDEKTHI